MKYITNYIKTKGKYKTNWYKPEEKEETEQSGRFLSGEFSYMLQWP